jgi:hypothetical protein
VTITQTTFAGNMVGDGGGGLNIFGAGAVTITDSTFVDNSGGQNGAGGLWNGGGMLTLTNSTVAYNRAGGGVGGLFNFGTTRIVNSTFAENSTLFVSAFSAGGIDLSSGTVELQNTLLARNRVATLSPSGGQVRDCVGPVTSLGHNLVGDPTGCAIDLQPTDLTGDPGLGDFTDDGTPGHGHFPLLPTSQAIDAGNDAACPPTDQLGQPRVGPCDIGAIEFQPPAVDVVAIRLALFVNRLSVLVVVATSSAAPDAELFVTVPGCLTSTPMPRLRTRYVLLDNVSACGNLDGQTATVTSSGGGSASALLR